MMVLATRYTSRNDPGTPCACHVPDGYGDAIGTRLLLQLRRHVLGEFDALYVDASCAQRQCHPPRADSELQGRAVRQLRQYVNHGAYDSGPRQRGIDCVVGLSDLLSPHQRAHGGPASHRILTVLQGFIQEPDDTGTTFLDRPRRPVQQTCPLLLRRCRHHRLDHLAHHPEGELPLQLGAARPQHPKTVNLRHLAAGRQQHRLADPSRPLHHQRSAPALRCPPQAPPDPLYLAIPLQQQTTALALGRDHDPPYVAGRPTRPRNDPPGRASIQTATRGPQSRKSGEVWGVSPRCEHPARGSTMAQPAGSAVDASPARKCYESLV